MAIEATNPTTVSATYDRWTISNLALLGDGCVDIGADAPVPVSLAIVMVKYRVREDGMFERSPLASDRISFTVGDIYSLANEDRGVASTLSGLQEFVSRMAGKMGLL